MSTNLRNVIIAFASDNKLTLDEATSALHEALDAAASQYKSECETFAVACDAAIDEDPTLTKESLPALVAMKLSGKNPAAFPATLKAVSEYVSLTYVGKRGRRAADDNSVRLTKRA